MEWTSCALPYSIPIAVSRDEDPEMKCTRILDTGMEGTSGVDIGDPEQGSGVDLVCIAVSYTQPCTQRWSGRES